MRSLNVLVFGVVLGVAAVACGEEGSNPSSSNDEVVAGNSARQITASVDRNAGTAQLELTTKLGAKTEAVRSMMADPSMSFWKELKRPNEVDIGKGERINPRGAGTPIFTSVEKDGDKGVKAYMPFSDSGLSKFSGLNMKLAYEVDTQNGYTLKLTNSEPIETKLLNLDIVEKNGLSFSISLKDGADETVDVTIKANVKMEKEKEKAAAMLSGAVAAADLLEKKFPLR